MPITGIAFCCAPEGTGCVTAAPPSININSRRLMPGLSLAVRARTMAQEDHFRYARRMTAKTPAVPFAHCTGKVSSGAKPEAADFKGGLPVSADSRRSADVD